MIQNEIKITGRVQGVGFRFFVERNAAIFDIKGWVKNTRDGGVLVMAQGSMENMEQFLKKIKTGPSLSRVATVNVVRLITLDDFSHFRIKY